MPLTIPLPPDDETKLSQRAAAAGQDVVSYVQQLIHREVNSVSSLLEAAEPFATAIEASGVTDQEFDQILARARAEARVERQSA
jgi:hypothetical protein